MKILISGATGFLGRALLRDLRHQGHDLVALVRSPDSAQRQIDVPFKAFHWDGLTDTIPAEALEGVDAVINLAGEPIANGRWNPSRKKKIFDSRVLGSQALLGAIGKSRVGFPKIMISASAVGYYGDRGDAVLTESSLAGEDFLAGVCKEWERATLSDQVPTMRKVALRMGMVLGPGGGALEKLLPFFKAGVGGTLGWGQQWMSWIAQDDLMALIDFSLRQNLTGPLNAVSPRPVRNQEFTKTLAKLLRRPALTPVPPFALKLAYGEMAGVLLASQRAEPQRALSAGFPFKFVDLEGALRVALRV